MPSETRTGTTGGVRARCARLVKIYPSATGETHALRGVDVEFAAGTVTAVVGPSGSGKSSLLGVLALREQQSGGELWVLGEEVARLRTAALRRLRRRVGWVAQRPTHSLYPHLSGREHLFTAARGAAGDGDLLDRLGLDARGDLAAGRLSGGEQQRLAVAVALARRPELLVADEPTAELDDESAALVLAELARAAAGGCALVLATHDARVTAAADRVLSLRHGVLSAERTGRGPTGVPIDSTGRLQLPPEALALFPGSRAEVTVTADGVVLRPPGPA